MVAHQSYQLLGVFRLVVHTVEHAVLKRDEVTRRMFQVARAGVQQLCNRVFAVQRHQTIPQGVVWRME